MLLTVALPPITPTANADQLLALAAVEETGAGLDELAATRGLVCGLSSADPIGGGLCCHTDLHRRPDGWMRRAFSFLEPSGASCNTQARMSTPHDAGITRADPHISALSHPRRHTDERFGVRRTAGTPCQRWGVDRQAGGTLASAPLMARGAGVTLPKPWARMQAGAPPPI